MELKQIVKVQSGGRVEAVFPSLATGQIVELVVRGNGTVIEPTVAAPQSRFGFAKGQIWMSDDFEAPLDEFKDYR